jgi:hypothetical protein
VDSTLLFFECNWGDWGDSYTNSDSEWGNEKLLCEFHRRTNQKIIIWILVILRIPHHSKNDSVESTFLRRRINVNSHTLSFYDSYSWFYCILHRFYVPGVFYGKNNYLPRRRFELTPVRKPHPSVHGYSNSWKMNY